MSCLKCFHFSLNYQRSRLTKNMNTLCRIHHFSQTQQKALGCRLSETVGLWRAWWVRKWFWSNCSWSPEILMPGWIILSFTTGLAELKCRTRSISSVHLFKVNHSLKGRRLPRDRVIHKFTQIHSMSLNNIKQLTALQSLQQNLHIGKLQVRQVGKPGFTKDAATTEELPLS